MGKVFGIRELELRPDASPAEFEQLMSELVALPQYPGTRAYVLRADRGARDGKYAFMLEIDSTATRDRYWPGSEAPSDEANALDAAQPRREELMTRLGALVRDEAPFTDYEAIAESA